jgi:Predicted membrane protein (DUF2127)
VRQLNGLSAVHDQGVANDEGGRIRTEPENCVRDFLGPAHPSDWLFRNHLRKLQAVLAGGVVRGTGFLALLYAAVLFTEGIGVYMEQRWAELLMIFATATLIPLEVRNVWHHPDLVGVLILLANCFIVWFLYCIIKRDKAEPQVPKAPELVETC